MAEPEWEKIYYFLVFQDENDEWRWNFRAPNHRKVASSGEGYENQADCDHAIDLLKEHGPDAPVGYPPEEEEDS